MLHQILSSDTLFVDTETTGLFWHQGNKPFSIIVSDKVNDPVYINLYDYNGTQAVASQTDLIALQKAFSDKTKLIVMHNAKFDMHMLANIGILIGGSVYDTMSMHRFLNNKLFKYDLGSLTGQKSDAVKEWIAKNPKIGKIQDELESGKKRPAYWKVPFEIMRNYAIQDVVALRSLYMWQQEQMKSMWTDGFPKAFFVELHATKTIFKAERRGILLDIDYTLKARDLEIEKAAVARARFKALTGEDFIDSDVALDRIFKSFGITLPQGAPSEKLKKTKPKTDEDTLLNAGHPLLAQIILEIRKPEKKVSTYFDNYLRLRNKRTGAVHCDFRQTGADTMRMSAAAPNVQNCPDESEDDPAPQYPIRGCFVPRLDYVLVSIDFAAQEMRSILDASGEMELAQRILAGEDVHQSTADMMGVLRKIAKNIAFGIIYGSGAAKTASQIKCAVEEARRLRDLYFSKLPNVKLLSKALVRMAEEFGYITTVFGNRLLIEPDFAYKAVNYFVQGTCAIHTKNAANEVDKILEGKRSAILLLIHDELLLEMHRDELHLLPEIRKAMADAYPHKILPQDTGVEIYKHRWGGETMD